MNIYCAIVRNVINIIMTERISVDINKGTTVSGNFSVRESTL